MEINYMRNIFIYVLFLLIGCDTVSARGLVLNLRYSEKGLCFDSLSMDTTLSGIGFDMFTYIVDKNRSISEHAEKVHEIVERYRNAETQDTIFLLSDRLSTFVGLDVVSRDTTIHGLITLTGAYNDGCSFLYDDVSIRKNLEMMDSISFDGSKEHYLKTVYRVIQDKKKGKKIKLFPQADNMMQDFYTLLNSPYGTSMIDFSLEEHLRLIKSWIGFMTDDERRLELEIDYMNLSWTANKYGVKYTCPVSYRTDYCVAMVKNMISYLQQKK